MSAGKAEQSVLVDAPPKRCFEALLDYEGMPEWQSAVESVEVLSRDRSKRGREVAWEIDAKVRRVSYTLRYEYDPPRRIGISFVEGDVKDVNGEYRFEADGKGTRVTLWMEIDPGLWLPGKVKRMLSDQVMRGSLEDLKRHVETG